MPRARPVAGVAAGFEFAARRRPPFVDAAGHALAYAPGQRRAARRLVVGAAQAAVAARQRRGQAVGHAAPFRQKFVHREIHAEAGAAGAAVLAIGWVGVD